jgi:LPXTG-motif cell wall-anchored protein
LLKDYSKPAALVLELTDPGALGTREMLLRPSPVFPRSLLADATCFVLYFRFRDLGANVMTANQTVQLVAGILAVVLVAIIFLRRKKKKKDEDDF